MYDIFFILENKNAIGRFHKLKEIYPNAKSVSNILDAQQKALTKFFWVVYDDLEIDDNFKFDYEPDAWSSEYIHTFLSNDRDNQYNGICLIPKTAIITKKEIDHRFFIKRKEILILASVPVSYDRFIIETYDDYLYALENSSTELFWGLNNNLKIEDTFDFDFKFTFENKYDRTHNHAFIHRVNGVDSYNGVFLFSKHSPVTKKEIDHRFIVNVKEWPIVASGPTIYETFTVNTYDDYLHALENSHTELFWAVPSNIIIDDSFNFDTYFNFDNMYDRTHNHAFKHIVNDKEHYNKVFLFSKHSPVTKKEIDHRFIVNVKEWPIVASKPLPYEQFIIENYDDYLYALNNTKTELFWGLSNNLTTSINLDLNMFFDDYDNEFIYDRTHNHAFIHRVNGVDSYNGVFLFSTHAPVSKKEIDHRFIVNVKEWPIVGSSFRRYNKFTIETYDDYLYALEHSETEMFWALSNNLKVDVDFDFDLYFNFDNLYDRTHNHAFIHRVNGVDSYNGVFLFSKHSPVTKKEIDHRFIVNVKEWPIVASGPTIYETFTVNTYDDYLHALENSHTELFWAIPSDVYLTRYKFDLYFNFDNLYDRKNNHMFLNENTYDGIILCSKHKKISKKEFDHKFLVDKKEWPIKISKPKPYDIIFISYNEPNADKNYEMLLRKYPDAKRIHGVKGIHNAHIEAAKLARTDMFWVVDADAVVLDSFKFDYYIPKYDINRLNTVFVWRSVNPINGLVYGYGGIKLLPKTLTINMDKSKTDMTTSISDYFIAVDEVSNVTEFNTDPFNTWKSAFRECAKLASKTINRQDNNETMERLKIWTTVGKDKKYGNEAIQGAKMGRIFGEKNKNNLEELKKINNFEWLEEMFYASYK